ncbi:nucleoside triphosphate pyrophosphohydrolase [Myxacorys almedinensis A]|uniref:Nucleoside triphosphate pyrophosphohydrolase n=2 Tax=Myxacorys TaxID=2056239 RepID=A0A8J7Z0N0_9CYAN|nr:nucleoside triphosphate pyrophosphohydrolase [Myxacorys almedinensis A]
MSDRPSSPTPLETLQQLIDVVARLRDPQEGCPWDRAQTPQTLIPYVIEEAYEVVDALRHGDKDAIADELGDLLLQVVLQAQIAKDQGQFDIAVIAQKITEKLIRRHPHVFSDFEAQTIDEVHQNWEQIKDTENPTEAQLSHKLKRYARSLPPLMAGMKISRKAAKAGFEWKTIDGVWDKFDEELAEFKHALDYESKENQQAELGDLLFTVINLARWAGLDPAEALQGTNERFIQRLMVMEEAANRPLSEYSLDELEAFWQQAKLKIASSVSAQEKTGKR